MEKLRRAIEETGRIPLGWASSSAQMSYLNFGDALSPVMVALVSGLGIQRVPMANRRPRLAAVGTIAQNFRGGDVTFWGTGCSPWKNPSAPAHERVRFTPPADTSSHVAATRGRLSAALLGARPGSCAHGDPVWLLPRFYRPQPPKRWDLGVIVHLDELSDRSYDANVWEEYRRYHIPAELRDHVRLISTVTPISIGALKDKLDEMLACRRLVSTSLHGMVIAESYGIPCLYFAPSAPAQGLAELELDPDGPLDPRIIDLYTGLGRQRIPIFGQDRSLETDWGALMRAVDTAWQPSTLDEDALLAAFPARVSPLAAPGGRTIWEHPLLAGITLQHGLAPPDRRHRIRGLRGWLGGRNVPQALAAAWRAARPGRARTSARLEAVEIASPLRRWLAGPQPLPLAWSWTKKGTPYANLGDALSAVIVCVMSGRPIARTNFHRDVERLAAVGTIAHALKFGTVHLWGTGLDATRNPMNPDIKRYTRPPNTVFNVHAVRGRRTAEILRAQGIAAPEAYGDPVWFLPRIFPPAGVEKTHDLGVILHLDELDRRAPDGGPKPEHLRYRIPPPFADRVRIINTLSAPTLAALEAKTREIVGCRRIVTTSFHGMVIAEAYGIPCAWFAPYDGGAQELDADDLQAAMDHRIRDFYSGTDRPTFLAYCQARDEETDWSAVIAALDTRFRPAVFDPRGLFESFPVPTVVRLEDPVWPLPRRALASLRL